jgi:hypothetical protein
VEEQVKESQSKEIKVRCALILVAQELISLLHEDGF